MVNPVWGTNWCLPRHTSTKTRGRQTALVYHFTLPQPFCLAAANPGQGGRGGGGMAALTLSGQRPKCTHYGVQGNSTVPGKDMGPPTTDPAATAHGCSAGPWLISLPLKTQGVFIRSAAPLRPMHCRSKRRWSPLTTLASAYCQQSWVKVQTHRVSNGFLTIDTRAKAWGRQN